MELAQSTLSASFIDKGARQLLLNLLGRLEHGQLLLRDGGERHSFGVAGTDLHAELVVQDPAFYRRLLLGGSIAAGETWVEGLWTSPDPVALVRLLARNLTLLDSLERRLGWLSFPFNKVRHWLNRNTLTGSRSNIAAHYDLGNTLYQGFLDSHMQYSSAIYPSAEATLEEGQQAKLRTICERLELGPDDHLLEIGTGWAVLPSMRPVTTAAGSPPLPSPGPSTTMPRSGLRGRGWGIASPCCWRITASWRAPMTSWSPSR